MNSLNENNIEKILEELKKEYKDIKTIHFNGNDDYEAFSGTLTEFKLDDDGIIVFTLLDNDYYYDIPYQDIKYCSCDTFYQENRNIERNYNNELFR